MSHCVCGFITPSSGVRSFSLGQELPEPYGDKPTMYTADPSHLYHFSISETFRRRDQPSTGVHTCTHTTDVFWSSIIFFFIFRFFQHVQILKYLVSHMIIQFSIHYIGLNRMLVVHYEIGSVWSIFRPCVCICMYVSAYELPSSSAVLESSKRSDLGGQTAAAQKTY